ncbi:hypothetical protein B0T18DRAFT_484942 [Schizothecium vesticola]|uniref:Zn(2)-C6 fungal-type domain-containing protein n=1 Tax=Schizothecium vesticola TaxID=314040 RepID=A0AA40KCU5_9PEZI|nr:hypothetical protein B0T18DRAFT_484942 [Schizothecium vesticola]
MALRFRNLDLDSFESELKNKSGRKGPRVRDAKSCLECRTRRKRCSRGLPCAECHQRGPPLECVYASTPRYMRPHADPLPSPPDVSRVNSPEERISPQPTGHEPETDSDANAGPGSHVVARSPAVLKLSPAATSSQPVETANIFRASGLKTRMVGPSHWLAPCRDMMVLKAFLDRSTEFQSIWSSFGELKVLLQAYNPVPPSPFLSRADSDGTGLCTLLPDRAQCEERVTKFCQSYNRIYGIIHPAALRDDVRQVYSGTLANPVHVARVVMVVAIAMQDSEIDRMHGRMLAREVEDCVNSSLRFQKPCIGAVQNLLLLLLLKTISASDTDKMHDMLSLQGLTGQIMFNMGLHRDPAPFPAITPYYAELRKRLWACYLRLSVEFCMRSGTRFSVSLDETDCPLPTATNLASLSGHHDATTHEQDMTDASFAVAAAQLTSIIAPRATLLETWDLATSTTHHFHRLPSPLHPISHHLLWSHASRAALTACFVVGRLRALDARRTANPQHTTRVFHVLLGDSLASLARRLRARAHLGPVAAKASLVVAVAVGVTERLFADGDGNVAERLVAEGVRTAGREVGEMKAALGTQRGRATTTTFPAWKTTGSTSASGAACVIGSEFQDFMSSSHDGLFGSALVPDFCFGGSEGMVRAEFCPGQFGEVPVGFESLWE